MATKNEVIKSIFEALPKLNTFWVDGIFNPPSPLKSQK